ncbi:hypothetical protein SBRY_20047 [Actinacidiphila bryophytorum]|uniref:Uncharacterized protein n=1 Tax=Actinacidiphila bryophytorum TaxID=1436133 RepID=A0A9W4E5A0_9ACTN|nr:hypothetical protein SBRY_20047 [Actinacidiphila bryophytorum]
MRPRAPPRAPHRGLGHAYQAFGPGMPNTNHPSACPRFDVPEDGSPDATSDDPATRLRFPDRRPVHPRHAAAGRRTLRRRGRCRGRRRAAARAAGRPEPERPDSRPPPRLPRPGPAAPRRRARPALPRVRRHPDPGR